MARPSTAKSSYQSFPIDSGYLSDLVESALRRHDDDTAAFAASSASGDADFAINTFEDTEWDVPPRGKRAKARAKALEKDCRALAARIKKPTRFPIIPLASTLARARMETNALKRNDKRRKVSRIGGPPTLRRTARVMVVDRCGRTRAASRILQEVNTPSVKKSSDTHDSIS